MNQHLFSLPAGANDRAVGVLVGLACGDALGAGYEFGPPLDVDTPVHMNGGGSFNWAPGEWTDDTSMAIPIARVLASGRPIDEASCDEIVAAWADWARTAPDVGMQTRKVLGGLASPTGRAAREAAAALHARTGRTGGNGSLMRTAPIVLGYLGDPDALAVAARTVSELTHFDPDAGDACVLWSLAIRHAVLTGEIDVRVGLTAVADPERWRKLIEEAEAKQPRDFVNNGWVVQALQGAWSAIHHGDGFVDALERAVRGGYDTDTVAAIAGSLVGAATGVSGIPARWRRILHGWPGLGVRDLSDLALLSVRGGETHANGWPSADRFPATDVETLVPHPHDNGVFLASLAGLRNLPAHVDAVVSLCRVGRRETDLETIEFWLIDRPGANAHLRFVLDDAADAIATLRAEGRTVVVHCFEGRSRTPAVAATYAARHLGVPVGQALEEICAVLPGHAVNPEFQQMLGA